MATLLFVAMAGLLGPAGAKTVAGADLYPPKIPARTSLPVAIAAGRAAITTRIVALNQLSSLVAGSKTLTTGDRNALLQIVDNDVSGLGQIQVAITTATSIASLSADESAMVLNFHVLSLVTPVVRDVVSADKSLATDRRLTRQMPEIEATISASGLGPARALTASALLNQLSGRLSAASSALNGVVGELLALTPPSIPGALPVIASAALATSSAAGDVKSASGIVATITTLIAGPGPAVIAKK